MDTGFRAHRIVVEVDATLLAALNEAAAARSSNVKKVTRTEVLRELIADHLLAPDDRKAGVA